MKDRKLTIEQQQIVNIIKNRTEAGSSNTYFDILGDYDQLANIMPTLKNISVILTINRLIPMGVISSTLKGVQSEIPHYYVKDSKGDN